MRRIVLLLMAIAPVSARAETPKLFLEKAFSCATLAEACNHFIDLGEAAAIKELKSLTMDDVPERALEFSTNERTSWVCRIMFLPKWKQPLRPPAFGGLGLPVKSMPLAKWPLFPVARSGLSYFVLGEGYVLRGRAEDPRKYIDYCVKNGDFRTERLTIPTRQQALKDVEEFRSSEAWKKIEWTHWGRGHYYSYSEAYTWEFMKEQAERIPVAGSNVKPAKEAKAKQ